MAKRSTKTKAQRLVDYLMDGNTLTIKQAMQKFGFTSPNSVTGTVCTLRDRGYYIDTVPAKRKGSPNRYAAA